MSDHADHSDIPQQNRDAEEPLGATRREHREQQAQSSDQADARPNVARQDAAPQGMEREVPAEQGMEREAPTRQDVGREMSAEQAAPAGDADQEPAEHSATTDHDVIRRWAEDRHATPATVEGAEHEGNVGELRFDFDFGNDLEDLAAVSWDDWFAAFDERGLEFVFQESTRPDGSASNDFRFETAADRRS